MDPVWTALAFGLVIPVIAIVGGLVIAGLAIHHKARLKELAYRERMAMIERGLVPSPETDPEKFDRAWESVAGRWSDPAVLAERHRAAGIITIGAGLAVMLLLYFVTDQDRLAFGVGGAAVLLGLAFIVNSFLVGRAKRPQP